MERISGASWQRVHFASPLKTRSLGAAFWGSCAKAPCKVMPIATPAAKPLTTAIRRYFRLFIVVPFPREIAAMSVFRITAYSRCFSCSYDDILVLTRLFDLDQF